ncbi:MAG: phage major capsid protein [Planctomycetota bacterium]|jgi:hypothetical protein
MAEFARALQAATAKYLKGAANETIQNSIILSELKKRGRIKYNQSGTSIDWRIKYKQRTLTPVADMEDLQFARQNLYVSATLPYRGYRMQDAISEKERQMVKGTEALMQIWPGKMESLMEDANDRLSAELFVDGNATGNTEKFHGLESIFGAATGTSTTQWTTSSETYAGLTLAAVHGTESDSSAYSPQILEESYTDYGTWASNPTKIVRALVSGCTLRNNKRGRPDMVMTGENRYNQFKDKLASEEQIMAGPPTRERTYAGLKGIAYDGVEVTWDFDCGTALAYCLNFDHIELRILTPRLWYSRSDYDHGKDAHTFSVNILGNMRINPRYQGKSLDNSA